MTAEHHKEDHRIHVTVITTAGAYPSSGSNAVPPHQKVEEELKKASHALSLKKTEDWIARVSGKEIDTKKSYTEDGLIGTIRIDFGPREGGGGSDA